MKRLPYIAVVVLVLVVVSTGVLSQERAVQKQAALTSPSAAKPAVRLEVKKVEFVPSYQMLNAEIEAKPDEVIVVVQTDWNPPGVVTDSLANYAFRYTTANSKTGSVPALAAGTPVELVGGQIRQFWICAKLGLISGWPSPSQMTSGFTVVTVLPKDVTSFTLSNTDIPFALPLIQRASWPASPAAK